MNKRKKIKNLSPRKQIEKAKLIHIRNTLRNFHALCRHSNQPSVELVQGFYRLLEHYESKLSPYFGPMDDIVEPIARIVNSYDSPIKALDSINSALGRSSFNIGDLGEYILERSSILSSLNDSKQIAFRSDYASTFLIGRTERKNDTLIYQQIARNIEAEFRKDRFGGSRQVGRSNVPYINQANSEYQGSYTD